ncbi:tetratricopeptide repeat protein [Xanthomarina sp. F1114]|uniref:tetratricopeptide repeat-containing sensor histidine kinase n=1 Tax=unclassified Xanthomarina TaxID=2649071 RepID=UPI00225E5077|nr:MULTISPECIES: tetratricopeptide repeat-containing sensor histidine kinase [unclassified Xanthomarina]MCX7548748.1 tetratricopeptide repeat protein [Xanthomarina sp. F1114]MCX7552065.1 tetratricopeptide repeat protein [Xanthomarina sp. F2636L]
MKKLLFLIFVLQLNLNAFSQSPQKIIDSLKIQLLNNPDEVKKAKIYGDLTWYYCTVSTDSALVYGKKAMSMAKKMNDSVFLAQTLNDYATVYYLKGDLNQSENLLRKSLKIRNKLQDSSGIAAVNSKLGNIFYRKTLLDSSMIYFLKSLKFYESSGNEVVANSLKSNIANIYMALKNYTKSQQYLNDNIAFFKKNNQFEYLSNSYVSMASLYLFKTDTANAITYLHKGIKEAEKADAFPTLGSAYNNLGTIYNDKKEYKLAREYIQKSIEIREKTNLGTELASSKLSLAGVYNNLGEFSKAKSILLESLKIFKDEAMVEKSLQVYLQLIPVYASESKPDSVAYYTNLYVKNQDLVLQEKALKLSSELETKYQTEKKEKEILLQQTEISQKESDLNRKNYQIISLIILAIVLSLFGYLLYNQQKLKHKQLKKENELKEALAKIETQNKLQEQRLHISRDLHDNIGAQLTFIISSVDNLKYGFKLSDNLNEKLKSISDFASSTIYELRDTIWAMNKNEITFEDLQSRISNFIEKANKSAHAIVFSFNVDEDMGKHKMFTSVQGMNIYRIIQEAINNSIKYAKATKIDVDFTFENAIYIMTISDNGTGFNYKEVELGNGLNNMKKRAHELDAEFEIKSEINKGTTVRVFKSI